MAGIQLRLLSLDGGGVRGLSSLQILKQLMLQIDSNSPPKPCDYFDMIGGTSTGGLQAIMLGRLRMTVDECIKAYTSLADSIFTKKYSPFSITGRVQGRYDSDKFVNIVKEIIVKAGLDENELFWEPDFNACRVFVCATSEETSDTVHLTSFKTIRARDDLLKSAKIWEVARATSAATSFFDAIKIGTHRTKFLDGGTGANNPVYEMWMLARDEFCPNDREGQLDQCVSCLVSIGTGVPGPKAFGSYPKMIAKTLISMVTETEKTARKFSRDKIQLNGRYFRFNVPNGLDDVAMEDSKSKNTIIAVTDRYLEDQDTFLKMKACGELLAERANEKELLDKVMNVSWTETRTTNPLSLNPSSHTVRTDWFMESPEYQTFTRDKTTVLWYSGPPSTSKSKLLLRIVRERRSEIRNRPDLAVCYYHVPVGNTDLENKPIAIFRRVIGQLLIRAAFCKTLEACSAGKNNAPTDWSDVGSLPSNVRKFPDSLRPLIAKFAIDWRTVFCNNTNTVDHTTAMNLLLNLLLALKGWDTMIAIDDIDKMDDISRSTLLKLLLKMLDRLRSQEVRVRIIIVSRPYDDIREILKDVPMIVQDTEYRDCLTSLYFDEMHFRRDQVDAPQTGTCGWIWDHPSYKKWLWDESNESNILWIKGKAGSGKSTLAKTIQASLSTTSDQPKLPSRTASPEILLSGDIYVPDESSVSNDIVADFFYSGRAGLRARSPRWMLQSLLHQVLKQDPSAFDMIRHHYRRLGQGWSYDLLKTALAVAITASRSRSQPCISPRIYFLLDAADESQKEDTVERIDVIEFLANLSSQAASSGRILKLLLVSRTANDIQASLGRVNMIEMHQQTVKDVEKIVQQGMLSLSLQLRGISESPSSSDDDSDEANGAGNLHSSRTNSGGITLQVDFWSSQQQNSKRNYVEDLRFVNDYLISNANGVILWVVLILKELRLALKVGFWTLNKIRELLTSLPKDLEHCYIEMVHRIRTTGIRDKHKIPLEQRDAVTRSVLSWAAFSMRALTLEEFMEILAIRDILLSRTLPQESLVSSAGDMSLSGNRIRRTAQVRNALLYYCDGFLESVSIPTRERFRKIKPKSSISSSDVVQLLHRSAKDFLLMDQRATPFSLKLISGSRDIVESSLEYLKLSLPAPQLPANVQTWNDQEYDGFCKHLKDRPLIGYILSALKEHLRNCTENDQWSIQAEEYFRALSKSPISHAWGFFEGWVATYEILPIINQTSNTESFRQTCLRFAARMKGTYVVRLLLETKVTDVSDALSTATRMRNTELVEVLLHQGPMVNASGLTEALFHASENGYADIVSMLLRARHIQPDARQPLSKNSPMHLASMNGHTDILDVLLGAGCDIEAGNSERNTPLHAACCYGRTSSVDLLLRRGANITPRNAHNLTPLILATIGSHQTIVKSILTRYALMDEWDASRATFTFQIDGDEALNLASKGDHAIETLLLRAKSIGILHQQSGSVAGRTIDTEPGAQNRVIHRLLGATSNSRDSLRLLSLADPSFVGIDRSSSRHSQAFLAIDSNISGEALGVAMNSTPPGTARPDSVMF